MAKVTITLVDEPKGVVGCTVDFDPVVKMKDDGAGTPAQRLALAMLDAQKTGRQVRKVRGR